MSIVSIAIQKGGSGKTTTALNLGAILQRLGKRVLLVDLDPQANLTQAMGVHDVPSSNVYTLLKALAHGEKVEVKSAILTRNKMDLIPSSLDLASAEMELVSIYGREKLLQQLLQPVTNDYQFILIDCPPALGMLTVNALTASDFVLLPFQAEFLPMKGVESFMKSFNQIKQQLNPKLEVLGYLLTKFDYRKNMNKRVLETLQERYPSKVFLSKIRINIALAQAQEHGQDIFSFDQRSNGAYDYSELGLEFLERVSS